MEPDGVAEDAEVVMIARELVAGLDLYALGTSAATAAFETENDQPFDDGTPGIAHHTPEDIVQSAMHQAVAELLFEELEDRGLSTSREKGSVSRFGQTQGCQ